MTPLTSSSACTSCACLADYILELEGRISMLYRIHEAEKFTNKNHLWPNSNTSPTQEPSMVPCPAASHLVTVPDDNPWAQLGANQKAPVSPTPHEIWLVKKVKERSAPLVHLSSAKLIIKKMSWYPLGKSLLYLQFTWLLSLESHPSSSPSCKSCSLPNSTHPLILLILLRQRHQDTLHHHPVASAHFPHYTDSLWLHS